MKLGRNAPCYCGSGKKYKKCCLNKPVYSQISKAELKKVEADFEQHLMRQRSEKQALEQIGIYSNYVKPVLFKGAKVWALGSTIYHSRPVVRIVKPSVVELELVVVEVEVQTVLKLRVVLEFIPKPSQASLKI